MKKTAQEVRNSHLLMMTDCDQVRETGFFFLLYLFIPQRLQRIQTDRFPGRGQAGDKSDQRGKNQNQ